VFTVSVVVLPGVVERGCREQLASVIVDGSAQVKLTEAVKPEPATAVSPIVVVPDAPREIVNDGGVATKLKSGVPLEMVTVRGEDVEPK
jgi:hypothetical protein